jgi:ribonuclease P protein component
MRFRAEQHLRRAADFQNVRTHGRRYDCGAFVLYYAPRLAPRAGAPVPLEPDAPRAPAAPPARAGFVASRSAVGDAVARARAKRRLRERFRAHQEAFPPATDLIFVARRSLNGLEPAALEQRFLDLCRKLFPTRAS